MAPIMLQASHRAIRLLGKGAAADTWLFADRERDRLVAVKLFPRPIPRSQRNSTLREITVPCAPSRAASSPSLAKHVLSTHGQGDPWHHLASLPGARCAHACGVFRQAHPRTAQRYLDCLSSTRGTAPRTAPVA